MLCHLGVMVEFDGAVEKCFRKMGDWGEQERSIERIRPICRVGESVRFLLSNVSFVCVHRCVQILPVASNRFAEFVGDGHGVAGVIEGDNNIRGLCRVDEQSV